MFLDAAGTSREMEIEIQISEALFVEMELQDMDGYKRGPDYVEVNCGCTSRKYGDAIGTLRVHANGQFLIACDCSSGCRERECILQITNYSFLFPFHYILSTFYSICYYMKLWACFLQF